MTVIRLILLVAVLGGVMLLLAQNWSPTIPLVFLGLRTQALSLAIWMLFSTAAGAFTSLLVGKLLGLASHSVVKPRQTTSYSSYDSSRFNRQNPQEHEFEERKSTPPPVNPPRPQEDFEDNYDDDWDLDKYASDDWDYEEGTYETADTRFSYTRIQDDREYEDFREPEDDYEPSASSYSYEKRDLKDSDSGKIESIYDADYRVIIPPASPSAASSTPEKSSNQQDGDDWGFLDEDFDDDKSSPS